MKGLKKKKKKKKIILSLLFNTDHGYGLVARLQHSFGDVTWSPSSPAVVVMVGGVCGRTRVFLVSVGQQHVFWVCLSALRKNVFKYLLCGNDDEK